MQTLVTLYYNITEECIFIVQLAIVMLLDPTLFHAIKKLAIAPVRCNMQVQGVISVKTVTLIIRNANVSSYSQSLIP